MFAKVFSQIFDSSIAEDYKVRHIFMDLLVMADSDGVVDKTPEAIARIANVPLGEVVSAIEVLSEPDSNSRTPDYDGRRIIPTDNHRSWGWRIVNFQKYRDIRDEEARRIANRSYKREERARKRQQVSEHLPDSQQSQPMSAHTEVEVDTEVEAIKVSHFVRPSLEEVSSYIAERGNLILPDAFMDFYQSKGWKVGNQAMKDWRAAVRQWERRISPNAKNKSELRRDSNLEANARFKAKLRERFQ